MIPYNQMELQNFHEINHCRYAVIRIKLTNLKVLQPVSANISQSLEMQKNVLLFI